MNTARVEPGASVVVIGCGGVGLSVVMGAALAGADPIVAVDVSEDEARARAGGRRDARGRARSDEVAGGADYVFEAIGLVETIEAVPGLLRSGGVGVLVGLAAYDVRASFDVYSFVDSGKTLVGSIYGGAVPALDFPRIADALPGREAAAGQARVAPHRPGRGRGRLRRDAPPRAGPLGRRVLTGRYSLG